MDPGFRRDDSLGGKYHNIVDDSTLIVIILDAVALTLTPSIV